MPAFAYLNESLCESALTAPSHQFDGEFLHKGIYGKAAALFRSLILNHPFVDGNKRIALSSLVVFLLLNRYLFYAPASQSVNYALKIARTPNGLPIPTIKRWIERHSIGIDYLSNLGPEVSAQKLKSLELKIEFGELALITLTNQR